MIDSIKYKDNLIFHIDDRLTSFHLKVQTSDRKGPEWWWHVLDITNKGLELIPGLSYDTFDMNKGYSHLMVDYECDIV